MAAHATKPGEASGHHGVCGYHARAPPRNGSTCPRAFRLRPRAAGADAARVMRIIGHRGAPWEAAENTLESFFRARLAGADGVELDVRRCATGEVVCAHDVTLQRLAGVAARVRTTGWHALRRYDLGRGVRLARLDDALALWAPHGVVNIELKTDDVDLPALVAAVARVIDRAPPGERIVSSFAPAALRMMRDARPAVRRGQLVPPRSPRREGRVGARARLRQVVPLAQLRV